MQIYELKSRPGIEQNRKLMRTSAQLEKLLVELSKRELPASIVEVVNEQIQLVNAVQLADKFLIKQMVKTQTIILTLIEKELKLVPRNLYRNRWMAIGMAGFGLPFGVLFGVSLDNMAFLGIGLPIGMVLGMGIGANMDKKALAEGRQLDLEV